MTKIEASAFSGCSSLEAVYITDLAAWCQTTGFSYPTSNPLSNGADLYVNGVKATDIVIPDSVTRIGHYTFHGCTSIMNIQIPGCVTEIGNYVFWNCPNLVSVEIADGTTSIGYAAFMGSKSFVTITIPKSVTSFGGSVFSWCEDLKQIHYAGTTIEWNAITKGSGWSNQVADCVVYCTDANLEI